MLITDFEYAGERLSDFGCIVCCINTTAPDSISLGSNITFNTIKNNGTNISRLITTKYDEVYTCTFDIGKFYCSDPNDNELSDIELSRLMRWLNRKEYHKFKPIYDNAQYDNVCFYGSFNATAIKLAGKVIGLTLTFTANSPFGYEDETEYNYIIENSGDMFYLYDTSDELGINYFKKVIITCTTSGDLTIANTNENRNTVIKNCVAGEILTLDCENKIITTSKESHTKLCNDFNYNFPRLFNTYENRENIFTVSIPCEINIKYSPIRKVGVIL
jgi:phage-related protein